MFDEIDALYKEAKQRKIDLTNQYNKDLTQVDRVIVKLRIERQKHCSHSSTRVEEDFNYHNNTEWKITVCNICDKELERK